MCSYGQGRKGSPVNLLSDHIGIVTCLGFEGAVICPDVDGDTDARDSTLIDLLRPQYLSCPNHTRTGPVSYHFSRFCAADGELEVGIFLPISEEEWEAG